MRPLGGDVGDQANGRADGNFYSFLLARPQASPKGNKSHTDKGENDIQTGNPPKLPEDQSHIAERSDSGMI